MVFQNSGALDIGMPWSDRDLFDLVSALDAGETLKEAAEALFRSVEQVEAKAQELGLLETRH